MKITSTPIDRPLEEHPAIQAALKMGVNSMMIITTKRASSPNAYVSEVILRTGVCGWRSIQSKAGAYLGSEQVRNLVRGYTASTRLDSTEFAIVEVGA